MEKLPWDSESHKARAEGQYVRDRSADPYHSSRWTRLSKRIRMQQPLCVECKKRGIIKASTCVDHIIPWPICDDFFDTKNLQALCDECNHQKGQSDKIKYRGQFNVKR